MTPKLIPHRRATITVVAALAAVSLISSGRAAPDRRHAQQALPLPDNVLFDIDLVGDAVPLWHIEDPRGVAEIASGVLVADAARHHLLNLTTLEVIGREGSGEGEFEAPHAIAVGDALYVADTGNHRIQRFDRDGQFTGAWGEEGGAPGKLRSPEGVAVARDGSVLVADTGNGRVQRFASDGLLLAVWAAALDRPTSVAVATDDSGVLVAEAGTGKVHRFTLEGESVGVFADGLTPEGADLVATTRGAVTTGSPPTEVERALVWVGASSTGRVATFDTDGNELREQTHENLTALGPSLGADVLVAGAERSQGLYAVARVYSLAPSDDATEIWGETRGPQRHVATSAVEAADGSILLASADPMGILRYTPDGRPAGGWSSPSWRNEDPHAGCPGPSSIDVAPDGTVYVANVCNGVLERWTTAGELVAAWPLVADGKVGEVSAVAALPDGSAVVADGASDELVIVGTDGAVRRRVGGPGEAAGQLQLYTWLEESFAGMGLDADADGRIFVSDEGNSRVQVFSAAGAVEAVIDPATGRDAPRRIGPGPLRVAPDGSFYLADSDSFSILIQRFARDGTLLSVLARCGDLPEDHGCSGSSDDDPDDPLERPVIAAGASGLVAVTTDAMYWYRPDGRWLGRLRDTSPGDFPNYPLPVSLGVGPAGDALVANGRHGVRSVSAGGTVEGRWRNAVAPTSIISSAYRAVPLPEPISALRTGTGKVILVEQQGRVALLDAGGDLLRVLAPMTGDPSGNRVALRGFDGHTYVQVAQPPLAGEGFLVYDDDGNLVDTLVTAMDGFDVAIAPDKTVYYVTFNADEDMIAVRPGGDYRLMRFMDLGEGQALSGAVDAVTTPPGVDYVLWVADRSGHLVRATPDGQILDRWDGSTLGAGPIAPDAVRVGPDGSLWVLYAMGTRLRVYTHGQPSGWRVTYHDGVSPEDRQVDDERVDELALDWADAPPALAKSHGNWSVRAARWLRLPEGPQRVHVSTTGGGVRLRAGDTLVLDRSAAEGVDEDVEVPGGFSHVEVDYVHHDGAASLHVEFPPDVPGELPTTTPTLPPTTPTPEVTARPTRRPYDGRTIYLPLVRRDMDPPFVDDFHDPSSGWPIRDTPTTLMEYRDGEYRIVNRTSEQGATVYSNLQRRTLDVQITVRSAGPTRGAHGLVFASDITSFDPFTLKNELVFVVQPDIQQWGLFSCTPAKCGRVQTGTANSISKDGPNTLRATWEKKWLRVYLNGERMWQRQQGDYKPALYHGITTAPIDAGFDSRFDNYTVREEWVSPRGALALEDGLRPTSPDGGARDLTLGRPSGVVERARLWGR